MRRRPLAFLSCLMAWAGTLDAQQQRLGLDEAVRMAVEYAPRLTASRAAVDRAGEVVRTARAEWYPTIGVDGSLVRFQDPMIVRPLHAFSLTAVPEFDRTLVQSSASVGFDMFDGGARAGRIRQAVALNDAAVATVGADEQAVIQATVESFLAVQSASSAQAAQAERLTALRAEVARVGRFLAEGRAARLEELRVGAALASALADSVAAAGEVDVALARLTRLTGWTGDPPAASGLGAVHLGSGAWPGADEVLAAALSANPALEASASRLRSAAAARQVAGAGWWPRIRVEGRTVAYGGTGSGTDFTTEWQAGLRVSYPLFTGGARSARIREAEAAERELLARHRELELAVKVEIDRVLARGREGQARAAALEAAVAQLTEVVRTERLALTEGAGAQPDYLRAEAELALTRAALVRSRHGAIANRTELARLMGRLTLSTLSMMLEMVP